MQRTQIYLTPRQGRELRHLAAATGRTQSQLIRDAVDQYLADSAVADWRDAVRAVHGVWADDPEAERRIAEAREDWQRRLDRQAG